MLEPKKTNNEELDKEIIEKLKALKEKSSLTLNEYQTKATQTAIYYKTELYKENHNWGKVYCALQLSAEAGEIASKYAKTIRKGYSLDCTNPKEIILELGDVLWYVANLAKELGYTLQEVATMNIDKLSDRAERGVLHGDGDHR